MLLCPHVASEFVLTATSRKSRPVPAADLERVILPARLRAAVDIPIPYMLLGGTRSEEAPRESFREDAQVQVFSQNTWRMNDPPLNIDQSLKRGGNTITPQKHHAETGHSWPALEVCSPHHDARCWERNHGALAKTAPVRDRNEALTVLGERCLCGGPGPVRFFTVASGLRVKKNLAFLQLRSRFH
ncbi:uncharacterized protein LOC118226812 [Anguilla anguilla]|uniref:uncharacterized protein LOC118226812 n=1 Tax=Anguilla anguilla TaxID=7936 RepID=UPI0015ACB2E9|nr:uncharacterized protein LOC118226812 [Anguilla anguilla]